MAGLITSMYETYKYVNDDLSDPRSKHFLFVSSPWQLIVLLVTYFHFCTSLGPRLMKNREPFNLKTVMVVYNALQISMSGFVFYQGILYGWPMRNKFFCEPVDYSTDPEGLWVVQVIGWFYYQKIFDLLDTVFFVLRKKNSHITFLHLYHHMGMVMGLYVATKYYPGGHMTFVGEINSLVHFLMYMYFLLSVIYPQNKKLMAWKKYLTLLQMLQFLLVTLQMFPTLFFERCEYPLWPRAVMTVQSIFMFCLFLNFYTKAYMTNKKDH